MKLFTIGFTKTTAEDFFKRLRDAGVRKIIDVRLNNVSQLSGFAKRDDLAYFAKEICDIEYIHVPNFAPTKEMLGAYRKKQTTWQQYENQFHDLISKRKIEEIDKTKLDNACLLCSEDKPHHCHRRIVSDYLNRKWGGIAVKHL